MPKHIDKTGQRFGKLLVVEKISLGRGRYRYKCQCDCGKPHEVSNSNLKNGRGTKSCGCTLSERSKKKWETIRKRGGLIGQKFGSLLVLEENGIIKNQIAYLCLCDCGAKQTVKSFSLKNGPKLLCDCQKRERREKSLWNQMFFAVKKRNARLKVGEFDLSAELFKELSQQSCHYCGLEPSNLFKDHAKSNRMDIRYSGLDRLDSDKSYFKENVVPCCIHCNRAKNEMSTDQFKIWVRRIHAYLFSGDENSTPAHSSV